MENNIDELAVIPMIDDKPMEQGEMIGDALSVISLKEPSDDGDPDRVVKRNSYRNLHRPNISHLDWVSHSSSSKEDAVIEKVKSFHSSHESPTQSGNPLANSKDSTSRSSARVPTHGYSPSNEPIREDSREVLTRAATLTEHVPVGGAAPANVAIDSDTFAEYVIQRETLGELLPRDVACAVDHTLAAVENRNAADQTHSGVGTVAVAQLTGADDVNRNAKSDSEVKGLPRDNSAISREIPCEYIFAEQPATGARSRLKEEFPTQRPWFQVGNKHDFNANDVLVDSLEAVEAFSALGTTGKRQSDEQSTESQRLEEAADTLTSDAMKVAVRRVSSDDVPLTQSAIRAADSVVIDMLKRNTRDYPYRLSASAGTGDGSTIQLASTIVVRVLDSACSTEETNWPMTALRATKLLVEDVLSSALSYVSRGADDEEAAKPTHVWSLSAIKAACRIVHDVMNKAAQTADQRSAFWEPPTICPGAEDGDQFELATTSEDCPNSTAQQDSIDQLPAPSNDGSVAAIASQPSRCGHCGTASCSEDDQVHSSFNDSVHSATPQDSGSRIMSMFGRRPRNT